MNDSPTPAEARAALIALEWEQVALHILAAEMSGEITHKQGDDARKVLINDTLRSQPA